MDHGGQTVSTRMCGQWIQNLKIQKRRSSKRSYSTPSPSPSISDLKLLAVRITSPAVVTMNFLMACSVIIGLQHSLQPADALIPWQLSSYRRFQRPFALTQPHGILPSRLFAGYEEDRSYEPAFEEDDSAFVDTDPVDLESFPEEEEEELSDEELLLAAGEWDERIAPFNTVHLTGRVGNHPTPKYLGDDGKVVVNLSLAVKRKYHPSEWEALEMTSDQVETDWYGLEIWGSTAEFVAKYVDKGSRVGVVGTLEIDEWNDRETGELRNRAKVIVQDFDVLETRAEAEARRARSGSGRGDASSNYGGRSSSGGGGGGDRSFFA